KHPWLTVTLFIFLFTPAILLIIPVGKMLQRLFPEPHLWMIFPGAALFILTFMVGMLVGAILFVLVMKPFVHKAVLAPFYIYPGVPVTSDLSARIFRWAYRHDD
ncbi:MAG TPA: hypothetical protein VE421_11735, partial [Burkholderiaceae bacterium]|nr:hypothetical protein [Burkholderiaceae bacterium]